MLTVNLAIIPSLIGFILNSLLSSKYSKELIRGIEVCEDAVIEKLEQNISSIVDYFKYEINRILARPHLESEVGEINDLDSKEITPNIQRQMLKFIKQTYKYMNKVECALLRIKMYRWIFVILLFLAIIELLLFLLLNIFIEVLAIIIICLSIFFLILLFCEFATTTNLIDKIRSNYGL